MSYPPLALIAVLFVLSMLTAALAQKARHISPPRARAPTPGRMELSTTAFPGLGSLQSPVVIVEFSGFECPCSRRHARTVLRQLLEKYVSAGKARYLFAQIPPHDGRFKAAVTSFGIQSFSYFETAVERLLLQHEPLERRKR